MAAKAFGEPIQNASWFVTAIRSAFVISFSPRLLKDSRARKSSFVAFGKLMMGSKKSFPPRRLYRFTSLSAEWRCTKFTPSRLLILLHQISCPRAESAKTNQPGSAARESPFIISLGLKGRNKENTSLTPILPIGVVRSPSNEPAKLTIPKGLQPLAQGCEARATLGHTSKELTIPKGLQQLPQIRNSVPPHRLLNGQNKENTSHYSHSF